MDELKDFNFDEFASSAGVDIGQDSEDESVEGDDEYNGDSDENSGGEYKSDIDDSDA